jgi:hypothetical protein
MKPRGLDASAHFSSFCFRLGSRKSWPARCICVFLRGKPFTEMQPPCLVEALDCKLFSEQL